ncbi:formyl transferase [Fomitopsis serialis]|uniref:formyl transferase n=1 Tax=Fomitopsis serialis TaxID=139415 RepID=UPI00200723CD|nr:formyl transferase [Neoantrodia serialis]KAH9933745.1 formyl transferase [Neoantrodia serialis]
MRPPTSSLRFRPVSIPLSGSLCSFTSCLNHHYSRRHRYASWNSAVEIRAYHNQTPVHDPLKILYLGRDEFSCLVLEELHKAQDVWQELVVVTTPDAKVGRRGSKLTVCDALKTLGQHLSLPVHFVPPGKGKDVLKTWQLPPPFPEPGSAPPLSHIIITASFGRILPNSVLNLFLPNRRLNVHPSLLPAYRGAAPIQHVLLDEQKETGVCVIEMMERVKGIDAGAIWGQERVAIPEGADYADLRDVSAQTGGKLLVSVLRDMLSGRATSQPQAENPAAPRAPLITTADAVIDFETMTAEQITRRSRAFSHQVSQTPRNSLKSERTLQLHSPTVHVDSTDVLAQLPAPGTAVYDRTVNSLLVRCASDTVLSVPQVKQQDRTLLKAKDWWNGVRPELRLTGGDEGPVQFLRPALTEP